MPQTPILHDKLHRFLFDNHNIRGQHVTLHETYATMLANHNYPLPVQTLLGELLVVTSLLTATLKFDGEITVQLQGDGPLKLMVINGNNHQQLRGVARLQSEVPAGCSFKQLIGNGYLVITISPAQGERYQGIVALEADSLSACIEDYFSQSEQLATRLLCLADPTQTPPKAAGILLQSMPGEDNTSDSLEHLTVLTQTVTPDELFLLPTEDILYRLFHQEDVRLFEPQPVHFHCTCSRQRCEDTLMLVEPAEVDTILEEESQIDMHCDYCGNHYLFDAVDIEKIRVEHAKKEQNLNAATH